MPRETDAIACYVLTKEGFELARRLARKLPVTVFALPRLTTEYFLNRSDFPADGRIYTFDSLQDCVNVHFSEFRAHIFLTATGIAVRCIASLLSDKTKDPAVVVADHFGRHVISLISGHLGGANELAEIVAQISGGEAVITTATDISHLPAADMLAKRHNCIIAAPEEIKRINAAIVSKQPVALFDPHGIFSDSEAPPDIFPRKDSLPPDGPAISADWHRTEARPGLLHLLPQCISVGIGCRRGVSADAVREAIDTLLASLDASSKALMCIATVDAKADEKAITDTARDFDLPLRLYTPTELAAIRTPTPSKRASQLFNVPEISVCEAAALLAAGRNAELAVPKIKFAGCVTVAAALSNHSTRTE